MLPAQAKDAQGTKPKFNLEHEFPYRIQFVNTAAEAARLRALFDRLAALRNAPEPNLDVEEEELPDFETTLLEPEPSEPEDTENVLYHVDTGRKISFKEFESLNFSHEKRKEEMFRSQEVEYPSSSSPLVPKDDKKNELSSQPRVKSVKYDIPSSSLPYVEHLRYFLTFLRSKKAIHDFIIDKNIVSVDMILRSEEVENPPESSQLVAKNDKRDEICLKISESIRTSPSKPGIPGSSKKTDTITYPKTQAMESQPSTSESPKCPTDAETTQLSVAQATKSTDSPELIDQLELRYPHKVYQYLDYPGTKVNVCTKDYCITCDPRYRRDRKTWLLHAKNRHYEGVIRALYF